MDDTKPKQYVVISYDYIQQYLFSYRAGYSKSGVPNRPLQSAFDKNKEDKEFIFPIDYFEYYVVYNSTPLDLLLENDLKNDWKKLSEKTDTINTFNTFEQDEPNRERFDRVKSKYKNLVESLEDKYARMAYEAFYLCSKYSGNLRLWYLFYDGEVPPISLVKVFEQLSQSLTKNHPSTASSSSPACSPILNADWDPRWVLKR